MPGRGPEARATRDLCRHQPRIAPLERLELQRLRGDTLRCGCGEGSGKWSTLQATVGAGSEGSRGSAPLVLPTPP